MYRAAVFSMNVFRYYLSVHSVRSACIFYWQRHITGIQYTERGVFEYVCNYMYYFFYYFPIHRVQFQYADNNINILLKVKFKT